MKRYYVYMPATSSEDGKEHFLNWQGLWADKEEYAVSFANNKEAGIVCSYYGGVALPYNREENSPGTHSSYYVYHKEF